VLSRRDQVLVARILSRQSDANIDFDTLCGLLVRLGYDENIRGSHHIFRKAGQSEIVNIQPLNDGKAKAYQVRQIRAIFLKYPSTLERGS
jgi:hypothetical protein